MSEKYRMLKYVSWATTLPEEVSNMLNDRVRHEGITRGGLVRRILTDWLIDNGYPSAANFRQNTVMTPAQYNFRVQRRSEKLKVVDDRGLDHIMSWVKDRTNDPASGRLPPEVLAKIRSDKPKLRICPDCDSDIPTGVSVCPHCK